MKKLVGIIALLAVAVLLGQAALAAGGGGGKGRGHDGQGGGEGREGKRPPVVFGVLQSVSGSTWTIKPEVPPHMRERAEQNGRELPQLPDKITVTVNDQTKFWLNGSASKAGSFATGSEVVVKLDKPARQGGSVAVAIADPETARQYILEKMKDRQGGGEGKGEGGGERRPHLIFGTVSAVSGSSITVKPELPDFIKDMPNKGEKMEKHEGKLPASISVSLDSQTKYVINKQEQSSNPFKTGDKVAILPMGEPGSASARIVSDYASAKARMQERMEKRQEKKNKGQ